MTQEANPYNAKKEWDNSNGEAERGFISADDGLGYPQGKKVQQKASEEPTEASTEKKYTRVDYKKRYDDLKKHYDKSVSSERAKIAELESKLKDIAQGPKTPPKSPEELKAFMEKYPDFYNVVETVSETKVKDRVSSLEKELETFRKREQEVQKREALSKLKEMHPDLDTIKTSGNFRQWVEQQPPQIQQLVRDNKDDISLASRILDMYKKDIGGSSNQQVRPQQKKPDASLAVKPSANKKPQIGDGKKVWTTAEINKLSVGQYEKFKDDIDTAFREGRVVRNTR